MKKVMWCSIYCALMVFCSLSADSPDMRSKLSLRGEASLFKPADELNLSLGVVTQSETAAAAIQENNQKMTQVIASLDKSGLSKKEYQTGQFSIDPVWSRQPKDSSDPNWSPSIVGYKVTNSLKIRTEQLEKAGQIIDAASKSGANSVDRIGFNIRNMKAYREEAIQAAAANAIAQAQSIAQATQQKLVRIIDISLDSPHPVQEFGRASPMMFAKSSVNSDEIAINPGDVEITANISLVYEIAPR